MFVRDGEVRPPTLQSARILAFLYDHISGQTMLGPLALVPTIWIHANVHLELRLIVQSARRSLFIMSQLTFGPSAFHEHTDL